MKAIRFLVVGAAMALALAACNKPTATDKPAAAPAAPVKPPLVTVNGKAISNELFEDYVKAVTKGKASSELSDEDREAIKENLVRVEVIAQQAEKDGLTKDPEIASRMELSRLNLLQQAAAQKYLKDRTPTENELRAEFDAQIASTAMVEYHARHIQVSGPDVGQKVIERLNKGEDFAALAKSVSADKTTSSKGGDLGWFGPSPESQPFTVVLQQLKKGEYTKTPVQTPYGWHVIQLLGTRDLPLPPFDAPQVQEQLKGIVLRKKFQSYSDELLKSAKIDPPLKNMPAATPAAPAATAPAAPAASAPPAAEAPKTN
jgi:peptidyl-prolyl cis-trans isomerase C